MPVLPPRRGGQDADVGKDAQIPQDRQQFAVAGHRGQRLAVDPAEQVRPAVGWRLAPHHDHHTPPGNRLHFLDKRHYPTDKVGHVAGQHHVALCPIRVHPVGGQQAGVGYPCLLLRAFIFCGHSRRRLHGQHLAAAQGKRQGDAACAAAHVHHHVAGHDVGGHRLQVGVKFPAWIEAELRRRLAGPDVGGHRPEQP